MSSHLCDCCNQLLLAPIRLNHCSCYLCQSCFWKTILAKSPRIRRCPLCGKTQSPDGWHVDTRLDYVIREAYPQGYALRRNMSIGQASYRKINATVERNRLAHARTQLAYAQARYDRLTARCDPNTHRHDAAAFFANKDRLYNIVFVRQQARFKARATDVPWLGLLSDDAVFVIETRSRDACRDVIDALRTTLRIRRFRIHRRRYVVGIRGLIQRYRHRDEACLDDTSKDLRDALVFLYGDLPRLEVFETAAPSAEQTASCSGWDRFAMSEKRYLPCTDEMYRIAQAANADYASEHVRRDSPSSVG